MDILTSWSLWIALGSIIFTNILLSGDNAVVIAMASRNLPKEHQKKAIFWGSAAAIILLSVLTLTAATLLTMPYLKIIGGILLLYIGIQLMADNGDDEEVSTESSLFGAIRTILVADLVMSLDNVVAVAASAENGPPEARTALILIGLTLSIPLIIFGSSMLLKVMDRFPIIIVLGAALLGLLAGQMFITDPVITVNFESHLQEAQIAFQIIGAAIVVIVGYYLKKKNSNSSS